MADTKHIAEDVSLDEAIELLQKLRQRRGNVEQFCRVVRTDEKARSCEDPGWIVSLLANEATQPHS